MDEGEKGSNCALMSSPMWMMALRLDDGEKVYLCVDVHSHVDVVKVYLCTDVWMRGKKRSTCALMSAPMWMTGKGLPVR